MVRLAVVAAVAALTGCGGGEEERPERFDPFADVSQPSRDAATGTRDAAPRWERVAAMSGSGAGTRSFSVSRDAIQWRARWRCRTGRLWLATVTGNRRQELAEARCPRAGTSTGVGTGPRRLAVDATGPWRVTVEQQVDTPLREPPLAAMRSPRARVLARGRFYDVERTGRGSASLYRLPSGRLALRFDRAFATSANTDLFVWLGTAARPRTTVQASTARHTVLRSLKSTLGSQNYLLPPGTDAGAVRSIVIWCEPVRIVYAVAALRPA